MNFRTSSSPFFLNKNKRSTDVIDAKCALNYQRGPPCLHFLYSLCYLEVHGVMYILCEWQRAMCCHLNLYEILRTAKASLINYLYTIRRLQEIVTPRCNNCINCAKLNYGKYMQLKNIYMYVTLYIIFQQRREMNYCISFVMRIYM